MFNTKKFFQAMGMSILLTIVISFILGFFPINYGIFLTIQTILTYGSMGYFAVRWNSETPYTSAYLGALLLSLLNLVVSFLLFNIDVFGNPEGIVSSISFAVIVSLSFATATAFLKSKREGVLN